MIVHLLCSLQQVMRLIYQMLLSLWNRKLNLLHIVVKYLVSYKEVYQFWSSDFIFLYTTFLWKQSYVISEFDLERKTFFFVNLAWI